MLAFFRRLFHRCTNFTPWNIQKACAYVSVNGQPAQLSTTRTIVFRHCLDCDKVHIDYTGKHHPQIGDIVQND